MFESSSTCPTQNYSHNVHISDGTSLVAPQLNYIIDIVLKLKIKLAKINTEVKELQKQLIVIHLSLINEVRHSRKYDLSISTPLQHNILFKTQKTKTHFLCMT